MKRHSTDLVSLAFGLIFAGIAAWWLVGRYLPDLRVDIPNLGLLMAAALIVLGLLGVVGSLRRERTPAPTPGAADVPTSMPKAADSDPYRPDTDPFRVDSDTYRVDSDPTEVTAPTEVTDPLPPTKRDDRPY